ncbi:bifunctional DNA-formamidopyrimidine glycosylase/DNA-(apurinic or apyrimidinic site) lyase [Frankia sp. CNm7]|uniref:Formamidopyrimidine-DNA glycosylase n=1 Tax=Frankia nepalensis TaxID=1836974 RepID=A0A937USG3_9ACTN|nr:bifunctional DNA-formamidopyrimidine glycosylase/DNA-(apurinic or apyrimidinic site) lyase [Frankia nepalensis]MBL7497017.1 bifunctional DNA-formamidopyrimidine glycosylase/DNA-(apurinic or apyrimidinic site) lyase [Frankia nepalensis]MBL7510515.1 bifunctional DNA-formamidopyrimidine glycosylase/DNA-(apurinic or apyrimidinic site) lyase [Frankia nepalensis]MBL7520988.1 bifunctional DNA-formamidopyrimidine glycosylase/DNA-(apurinic or apyrimidinic site) lyase [Frankia nepalensis]MBL7632447.1 
MPELPEVEVVRRGLERGVVGRSIATVRVLHPRAVRRHAAGAADFEAALAGQTITAARRRGKYLWLALASPEGLDGPDAPAHGDALLGHLGMSGQLLVVPPTSPDQTHLRVRFTFTDGGRELRFVDQRTFGGMAIAVGGASLPAPIEHIARDPLDPLFDDDAFVAGLAARRTGLKRALLDQRLVSGIGNIYADEALWAAGLHYDQATETLGPADAHRLLAEVRAVLTAALAAGGTSFDRLYVSTEGVSGLFERELAAYGRGGQPCRRCETPIRRDAFMNRSSFTCPTCQPHPRQGGRLEVAGATIQTS